MKSSVCVSGKNLLHLLITYKEGLIIKLCFSSNPKINILVAEIEQVLAYQTMRVNLVSYDHDSKKYWP
jgi:hypothetical protein